MEEQSRDSTPKAFRGRREGRAKDREENAQKFFDSESRETTNQQGDNHSQEKGENPGGQVRKGRHYSRQEVIGKKIKEQERVFPKRVKESTGVLVRKEWNKCEVEKRGCPLLDMLWGQDKEEISGGGKCRRIRIQVTEEMENRLSGWG